MLLGSAQVPAGPLEWSRDLVGSPALQLDFAVASANDETKGRSLATDHRPTPRSPVLEDVTAGLPESRVVSGWGPILESSPDDQSRNWKL